MYQSYLDAPEGPRRIELVELLEKQTLRQITQAMQELSLYCKRLFDTTAVPYDVSKPAHISRMSEHLVRRAVGRAEIAPIDDYYEGEFDVRRVRWLPTVFGTIAQDLRVDAKASTETSRVRLSAQQFPMAAEVEREGVGGIIRLRRTTQPHTLILPRAIPRADGTSARTGPIAAITTAVFIHLYYKTPQQLRSIFLVAAPHQSLRGRYNPSWQRNFLWSAGPGPTDPRAVRLNLARLRENPYSRWRVQRLSYAHPRSFTYTDPVWSDRDESGNEVAQPFQFVPV
jgi:hypothetical protein